MKACPECDALFRIPDPYLRRKIFCPQCNALALRGGKINLDRICAVTIAALIVFLIAQTFPILELNANGMVSRTTLLGAIEVLWAEDMQVVAVMVFCAAVLFPLIELLALLYVLLPLRFDAVSPGFNMVLRAIHMVRPWGMIEVFMLGILITIVKMVSLARVIPEAALFAFAILTVLLAVVVSFDPKRLWELAERCSPTYPALRPDVLRDSEPVSARAVAQQAKPARLTATNSSLLACHACDQLTALTTVGKSVERCPRCDSFLHRRHPNSLVRTWAFLLAAAMMYIPANLLPVMQTSSILGTEDDTIMSGVVYFWTSGDWALSIIIFIASVMVPMLKLSVLLLLVVTAQHSSVWRPLQRAKLYRLVEQIGRWSMLDVFVVTLTVSLVRFGSFAVITAGPGAIAFGSVVILTIIASQQFDPRLIWDPVTHSEEQHG